ncbi:thioesterase II family protein [Streptomyces sp. NRRL F-5126]|uniref:thioesterase II family protein n=1 Tax=Streptomyces sp. NRRL F-5126 TaxID=1463857 RepID=UPI00068D8CB5|nr:alpha/beta fold hydrolase [Streptomyces sp. NRRL F-5126]
MSAALPPWLFCFHHAGAGTSAFAQWQAVLGDTAEVVPILLPGRGTRVREARITDPVELVAEIEALVGPMADERPYLVYGHSLGGLAAYTFARTRCAAGLRPPERVVVGAVQPPHLRSPVLRSAHLPDLELLFLLVGFGALPLEALHHEELWRRRVLPALRDDLKLGEALCVTETSPAHPLDAPILAVGGSRDPIAPLSGMAEWARYAPGGFELRTVPGDHFFVRRPAIAELLRDVVAGLPATHRRESSAV